MTRDTYAKQLIKAAEAAFHGNKAVLCPHEDCNERLSVRRQSMFSTRSLFCPVHGRIFQEQPGNPFGKLDWDGAAERVDESYSDSSSEMDEEEESEGELLN